MADWTTIAPPAANLYPTATPPSQGVLGVDPATLVRLVLNSRPNDTSMPLPPLPPTPAPAAAATSPAGIPTTFSAVNPTDTNPRAIDPQFLDYVKRQEDFRSQAYRDGRQWSIGYGTRTNNPNEQIDQAEAERRLNTEINRAAGYVDNMGVNLSPSQRHALIDLTYNTGPAWQSGPIGQAVRQGDWDTAGRLVSNYYTTSRGQRMRGLENRRAIEAQWLQDSGTPATGPYYRATPPAGHEAGMVSRGPYAAAAPTAPAVAATPTTTGAGAPASDMFDTAGGFRWHKPAPTSTIPPSKDMFDTAGGFSWHGQPSYAVSPGATMPIPMMAGQQTIEQNRQTAAQRAADIEQNLGMWGPVLGADLSIIHGVPYLPEAVARASAWANNTTPEEELATQRAFLNRYSQQHPLVSDVGRATGMGLTAMAAPVPGSWLTGAAKHLLKHPLQYFGSYYLLRNHPDLAGVLHALMPE